MKRARNGALLLSSLLLLPLPTVPAGSLPWIVDRPVHCVDEEVVINHDLRVVAGGSLTLEGCTLIVDSPAYVNQWIGGTNEGLTISVDKGGRLSLLHSETRHSAIVPKDDRYGFYITVRGFFSSDGAEGAPNEIRGLEGYMAEAQIGGGLQVVATGSAYLNHTAVKKIYGPALFVHDGAQAYARNVTVSDASGAFAVFNASLTVVGASLGTGIEGIRTGQARLVLDDVRLESDRAALMATRSNITVRNSSISGIVAGVRLVDSNADVESTRIRYGLFGVVYQPGTPLTDRRVRLTDCRVEAVLSNDSLGVSIDQGHLDIERCDVANNTKGGLAVRDGSLRAHDVTFTNNTPSDIATSGTHPISLSANRFSSNASVRILYPIDVQVYRGGRYAVSGADVDVQPGISNSTADQGAAQVIWEPPLGPDMMPLAQSTIIRVTWDGRTLEKVASWETKTLEFQYPGPSGSWILPLLMAAAGITLALFVVKRARQKARRTSRD